jgi:hypothetical protein
LNTFRKIQELKLEMWKLNDELNFYLRKMNNKSYLHFYNLSKELEDNYRDELDSLIEKKWKRISKAKAGS